MTIEPVLAISLFATLISLLSLAIAFRNYKISIFKWKNERLSSLLKWSDEAMLLFSEAIHICDVDQDIYGKEKYSDSLYKLRVKLSAHVDKGRWLFPNFDTDQYGLHKEEEIFRGYRHPVLDQVMIAYRAVSQIPLSDFKEIRQYREDINRARRKFTNFIHNILNRASTDTEIKKFTKLD